MPLSDLLLTIDSSPVRPTFRMSQIGVELAAEYQSGDNNRGSHPSHHKQQRVLRESLIRSLEAFVKGNETSKKQEAILGNEAPNGKKRTLGDRAKHKSEEEIEKEKNLKILEAMDEKHREAELNRSQLNERFGPLFEDYRTAGWTTLTFVVALLLKNTIIGICVGLQQGLSARPQSDVSRSLCMVMLLTQLSFSVYHLIVRPEVSRSLYLVTILANWGEVGVCLCLVILTWRNNDDVKALMLGLSLALLAVLMIYVFVLIGGVVYALSSAKNRKKNHNAGVDGASVNA